MDCRITDVEFRSTGKAVGAVFAVAMMFGGGLSAATDYYVAVDGDGSAGGAGSAVTSRSSEPTWVFLNHETSSFWRTATNNVMTVPVDFPEGAASASLSISAPGYSVVYQGIVDREFKFTLPAAESPDTENVYDLRLEFDEGTVREARMGLIDGYTRSRSASARCILPSGSPQWRKVRKRAVLPVPYKVTSITAVVNGEERSLDTGSDGAQGWYVLQLARGDEVELTMVAEGTSYHAALRGMADGVTILVK